MEKSLHRVTCIYFEAISIFMVFFRIVRNGNLDYLAIFVLVLVDWVQSQQNSGAEKSEAVAFNLKFGIQFQGEIRYISSYLKQIL